MRRWIGAIQCAAIAGALAHAPAGTARVWLEDKPVSAPVVAPHAPLTLESHAYEIRPERVTARYTYRNTTDRKVRTTLRLPLPPYGPAHRQLRSAEHEREVPGFAVWVDGARSTFHTELRAIKDGRDVTAPLRKTGLSSREISGFAGHDLGSYRFSGLVRREIDRLRAAGLIGPQLMPPLDDRIYIDEPDPVPHGRPLWKVAAEYTWDVSVAPGASTEIRVMYRPFAAVATVVPGTLGEIPVLEGTCVDDAAKAWEERATEAMKPADLIGVRVVELDVAAPRGSENARFGLVVRKGLAGDRVLSCWRAEMKSVGKQTLAYEATGPLPRYKVRVGFLTRCVECAEQGPRRAPVDYLWSDR